MSWQLIKVAIAIFVRLSSYQTRVENFSNSGISERSNTHSNHNHEANGIRFTTRSTVGRTFAPCPTNIRKIELQFFLWQRSVRLLRFAEPSRDFFEGDAQSVCLAQAEGLGFLRSCESFSETQLESRIGLMSTNTLRLQNQVAGPISLTLNRFRRMLLLKKSNLLTVLFPLIAALLSTIAEAQSLKLHGIFTDHMVLQRDKPITIWGWADDGEKVSVQFGNEAAIATAAGDAGRWEVTFPAREASTQPVTITASTGDEKVELQNILIGDVWVMYGQSNMAFALQPTIGSDMAMTQADMPLLRHFRIQTNEQSTLQTDIRPEAVINGGWEVSTPETALGFSAIGYHFGANLQRSLGIPVGLISAARGGASIESMVPAHKFDEHPISKRYAESVAKRVAEFDHRSTALEIWERQLARAKSKKVPEANWPKKPDGHENLTSWNIPGKSPSDAASIYNGMFGVFKGLHLKGVLFHQGYNNAISGNCRPKLYRVLTKLMVEGIREDFADPDLAFGIIGLCAGADAQNEDSFELESIDGGPYIREAQRLGLADVENQTNLMFLPAYDLKVPGLHPAKKREHGERAARWAMAKIYRNENIQFPEAELTSAERKGDVMVLTFSTGVVPDDNDSIPRGFSIAGEDGKFYMAHARYQPSGRWNLKNVIEVWSPLVKNPFAVRYAWARAPIGNLKVIAHPDRPFPSFRTDEWDFPESDDPTESAVSGGVWNAMKADANERLETRHTEEANRAVEVLDRLKTLGKKLD